MQDNITSCCVKFSTTGLHPPEPLLGGPGPALAIELHPLLGGEAAGLLLAAVLGGLLHAGVKDAPGAGATFGSRVGDAGALGTEAVLLGAAARGLSLAAGTTLEVAALSTGHALVLSGKVLAFIPNEAGKALLHHARAA